MSCSSRFHRFALAVALIILAFPNAGLAEDVAPSEPDIAMPQPEPVVPAADSPPSQSFSIATTQIAFQGFLTENGTAKNGTVSMVATIYNAITGGTNLWTETHASVPVTNGVFNIALGSVVPLEVPDFTGAPIYLGIAINSQPELPRTRLLASPFAMRAAEADHAATADAAADGIWSLNGSDAFRTTGNVGIGTSTPSAKLDIVGAAASGLSLKADTLLYVNKSNPYVGVGRSTPITGADRFGIRTPATTSYGGMYIDTQGAAAWPFYGYATAGNSRAWHYYDGATGDWNLSNGGVRLTVGSSGFVGVGRTTSLTPEERFGIRSPAASGYGGMYVDTQGAGAQPFYGYGTGGASRAWHYYHGGTGTWHLHNGGTERLSVKSGGNVGIGTTDPTAGLSIVHAGGIAYANVGLRVNDTGASTVGVHFVTFSSDANTVLAQNGTGDILRAFNAGLDPVFKVLNSGEVVTPVLQITGGSDVVESFQTGEDGRDPGTLVVIDEALPGWLCASSTPYDHKLAGVVSGAGGVQSGIRLGQAGVLDGDTPVAVAGRVYVKCCVENGPIRPGDLLTTSSISGHAMRATDRELSHGAVLGKAMSRLDHGTGLVLVLVNLH